jgi:hypothetical protein
MGKKRLRAKYTSKGEREANRWVSKAVARDVSALDRHLNKMDAFLKGKKVFFTIPNDNPNETNKPFKRIEGKRLYGDFRTFRSGKIDKEKTSA